MLPSHPLGMYMELAGTLDCSSSLALSNADSPLTRDDGSLVFVKPWEEDQKFVDFIQYLTQQELNSESQGEEVRYAQTRKYAVEISIEHANELQRMTIYEGSMQQYLEMLKRIYHGQELLCKANQRQ
jgi:hypothetical protein